MGFHACYFWLGGCVRTSSLVKRIDCSSREWAGWGCRDIVLNDVTNKISQHGDLQVGGLCSVLNLPELCFKVLILNLNLIWNHNFGGMNRVPHLEFGIERVGSCLRSCLFDAQSLLYQTHVWPDLANAVKQLLRSHFARIIRGIFVALFIRSISHWKIGRHIWGTYAIK